MSYISREAAIEAITPTVRSIMEGNSFKGFIVIEKLRELPSAQPERKKGRWIEENPQNSPDCRLIKCSECGDTYIVNMSIDYADWIEGRNFCRRCGADFRGVNNGKST